MQLLGSEQLAGQVLRRTGLRLGLLHRLTPFLQILTFSSAVSPNF